MLKKLFFIALMMSLTLTAFAQPKLAILPFSGGAAGEGEIVAALFFQQPDILRAFTVIPRTSAFNARLAEQNFQMSGYTDSDTIARLGSDLGADFVVSGHIRRLGGRNLIIATIINVETFEQLAGDHREYQGDTQNVRSMLPEIARKMIDASRRDTSSLPKLAVAPFNITAQGADAQDGETLSQILAVEIANTGRFAVLPRATTMQAALKELEIQMSGYTAEEEAKKLGGAINAEYVLSGQVGTLGTQNIFTAQILNVEKGTLIAAGSRDYRSIGDGIEKMKELALLLTNEAEAQELITAHEREQSIRDRELSRAAFFSNPARFWSVGASAGSAFADPLVLGTISGTIAPFRYSFLELGCDVGFLSKAENVLSYYSIYPFVHYAFFMPFPKKGGWYVGVGGSYMIANYQFEDLPISRRIFAADAIAGVIILDFLNISYTLRTDFASVGHKASVGYCYRFK